MSELHGWWAAQLVFLGASLLPRTPLASPVDYDALVVGAELRVAEGGLFSGLLDLAPESTSLIPGVERAFPPDGLRIGDEAEAQERLGYSVAGALILAADSVNDNDRRWAFGQHNPSTRSHDRYFPDQLPHRDRPRTLGIAIWQIFGSSAIDLIGAEYDGINHWRMYPEEVNEATGEVTRPGELILTWENIPAAVLNNPDNRRNSFQMILTHVGNGDADVELRFARCDWHNQIDDDYFVISGFHTGIIRENGEGDDVYHPGQTIYHPDSFTSRIKRMCAYSNIGVTGVWHYEIRDGVVSGCGIADAPYQRSPEDRFGDRCEDNNNMPGDGCSPGCWVEQDDDEDGVADAPPQEPRTPDGLPVNPDGLYDNCISRNPEFDCEDLDSDGDNVLDRHDNCIEEPNNNQRDYDNDGLGDACDNDADGDGIVNQEDLCPLYRSANTHNLTWILEEPGDINRYRIQVDSDRDSRGVPVEGGTPGGDACDPDDDNDGVSDCGMDGVCRHFDDGVASFGRYAFDAPGEGFPRDDGIDNDRDGRIDEEHQDPRYGEGLGTSRADRNGFDDDGDGVIDEYTEELLDDRDDRLIWSAEYADEDNCRVIPNPDQANLDGDVWGDACDDDVDGDYVLDCGNDRRCAYNKDHRDNDHDGVVDEATECADGCPPDNDLVDNDLDYHIDEVPIEFGAHPDNRYEFGDLARESSEDLLAFRPWPGPDADGSEDNCPRRRNFDQRDSDGDGIGDACDDDDGDGFFLSAQDPPIPALIGQHAIGAPADNCPDIFNPDQTDSDGDGIGDACEADDDADGVEDELDNCPQVENPNQNDLDGDGEGDVCDADLDGDGHLNEEDTCRFLFSEDNTDTDGDDLGDACDGDDDNDGLLDPADNCPLVNCENLDPPVSRAMCVVDTDGDGQGDVCDDDDDDDGLVDGEDNCRLIANPSQLDTDRDGFGDVCESTAGDNDTDGDGRTDDIDNCPLIPNGPDFDNFDGDEWGDACDDDDDNDGFLDSEDGCPRDARHHLNSDNTGFGDECGDDDDDDDGVKDDVDNCPLTPNRNQANNDATKDGGDACDDDDDNDSVVDTADNCEFIANRDQKDQDRDGAGDACDDDLDGDGHLNEQDNCESTINPDQADYDNDGRGDRCTDSDIDGVLDFEDNCVDDPNRNQADLDGDGTGDECDPDYDEDAIERAECLANNPPLLWAIECEGGAQKLGCSSTPGRAPSGAWWLLPLGMIAVRRRRH